MKKIDLNNKKILVLIIIIFILLILIYIYAKIINQYRNIRIFALEAEKYSSEVNHPVFRVDKIIIYSDANVEDLSDNQDLSRINVSQFTDFAIYINNFAKEEKLSEENTVNRIFIDNIGITSSEEMGTKKFSTKNINDLGKYVPIDETGKEISYNVIHRNIDKDKINNTKSFYTDCSEPLIISYVNENIVQSVDASDFNEILSLDGSILRNLNIDLNQLNYKVSFTINIENNLGEKFQCNCSLDVDLEDGNDGGIYSGYTMQSFDVSKGDYRFKKV